MYSFILVILVITQCLLVRINVSLSKEMTLFTLFRKTATVLPIMLATKVEKQSPRPVLKI